MTENELEKNLKKVEEIRIKLKESMGDIINCKKSNVGSSYYEEFYKQTLENRNNLSIQLNYYQNKVIIEQHNEILKDLNIIVRDMK